MSKGKPRHKFEPRILGRPPSKYTDEEVQEIGESLMEWMDKCDRNKIPVVHLSEFYSEQWGLSWTDWQMLTDRGDLAWYYEKAKDWILKKTLSGKDMPTAYGSRFLAIYSKELREHERDVARRKAEDEAKAKAKEISTLPPNEVLIAKEQTIVTLLQENLDLKEKIAKLDESKS